MVASRHSRGPAPRTMTISTITRVKTSTFRKTAIRSDNSNSNTRHLRTLSRPMASPNSTFRRRATQPIHMDSTSIAHPKAASSTATLTHASKPNRPWQQLPSSKHSHRLHSQSREAVRSMTCQQVVVVAQLAHSASKKTPHQRVSINCSRKSRLHKLASTIFTKAGSIS